MAHFHFFPTANPSASTMHFGCFVYLAWNRVQTVRQWLRVAYLPHLFGIHSSGGDVALAPPLRFYHGNDWLCAIRTIWNRKRNKINKIDDEIDKYGFFIMKINKKLLQVQVITLWLFNKTAVVGGVSITQGRIRFNWAASGFRCIGGYLRRRNNSITPYFEELEN